MSATSTNPMIPTMAYAKIQSTEMMVIRVWFGSGHMDDRMTFGWFLVHLLYSSVHWISARYKWRRQGFHYLPMEVEFPRAPDLPRGCPARSVSNGSGLPGCGPGLEPDRMVQFGLLPGKQGYPAGSGTGWNRTAVPYYGSCNFASN